MKGSFLPDLAAPFYDWMTAQEVWRAHVRSLIERFSQPSRKVLDLGTGPAVSAIVLAEALPDARVTGLDLSAGMLRRARARVAVSPARDRIKLVRGDALRLPFPDGFADAATGHSFLYLVPDRPLALAEARRVLRPGGRLVLLEPRAGSALPGPSLWRQSFRFGLSMLLWRVVSGMEGRFSEQTLGDLLWAAGFSKVQVTQTLGGLGLIASGTA